MTVELPTPSERRLFLTGEVADTSVQPIIESILKISEEDEENAKVWKAVGLEYKRPPIELYIDSPGGSVYAGMGLIDVMNCATTPVNTTVIGKAMSMGFCILAAGKHRTAMPNSALMYHDMSYGQYGSMEDHKRYYKVVKDLAKRCNAGLLKRTKLKKAQLKDIKKAKRDWYLAPETALTLNIIDEIKGVRK